MLFRGGNNNQGPFCDADVQHASGPRYSDICRVGSRSSSRWYSTFRAQCCLVFLNARCERKVEAILSWFIIKQEQSLQTCGTTLGGGGLESPCGDGFDVGVRRFWLSLAEPIPGQGRAEECTCCSSLGGAFLPRLECLIALAPSLVLRRLYRPIQRTTRPPTPATRRCRPSKRPWDEDLGHTLLLDQYRRAPPCGRTRPSTCCARATSRCRL
jgi:hypothetical protein